MDSEIIEPNNVNKVLNGVDAILVPGGFGHRGIEGMITTAEYARENKIPYLGICFWDASCGHRICKKCFKAQRCK
ncbi:MAG: hypothetical protein CM1200mP12_22540 [Gammaproteobacteria bacterium]|nr:MAG: hypothetical protein CM1200mP12_22540 [Gammaproteobacteria bacterium]